MGENAVNRDKASDTTSDHRSPTNTRSVWERLERIRPNAGLRTIYGALGELIIEQTMRDEILAEIRRLEGEARRWQSIAHGFEERMMRYDDEATRYRKALEWIRDRFPHDEWRSNQSRELVQRATRALEADHE